MTVNPYVFIVGCPRSETTLLQRIVDAHPEFAVDFEMRWISRRLEKRRGDFNLEYLRESYGLATYHMRRIYSNLAQLDELNIEEVPLTLTHREVNLDHILLDGDRPSLVDLDNFAAADPVLDLTNVLAQLKSLPFRFPLTLEDSWSTAAQVLVEEYFSHVPRSWRRRLLIHYAGAVLKFSVGFFGRQKPDWPDKIATLLEEAKASLAGRIW